MTSATSPAPNVVTLSSNYQGDSYNGWKAFNNNNGASGSWLTNDDGNHPFPHWLKFDFGSGSGYQKIVKKYKITAGLAGDISLASAAKSWTFEGSNTGGDLDSEWTILDTRTNETSWASNESQSYSFSNSTAYRFYRLKITANNYNNNGYTSIDEVEMFGLTTPDTVAPAAVTNLSSDYPTISSIMLKWTSPCDDNNSGTIRFRFSKWKNNQ